MPWPDFAGFLKRTKETPGRNLYKKKTPKQNRQSGVISAPYRNVRLTFEKIGDSLFAVADSIFARPYYHWYLNGSFIRTTRENTCGFTLDYGEQALVGCIDTTYPDFDPIANAPEGYPAVFTLYFIRSLSADVKEYLVQQKITGSDWEDLGKIIHDESIWEYTYETPRLNDGVSYEWQSVPYDILDNPGTPQTVEAIIMRRVPDAPSFDVAYSGVTEKITWSN